MVKPDNNTLKQIDAALTESGVGVFGALAWYLEDLKSHCKTYEERNLVHILMNKAKDMADYSCNSGIFFHDVLKRKKEQEKREDDQFEDDLNMGRIK